MLKPDIIVDQLDAILAARPAGAVYTTVGGVPIVGVPVADLIGAALDEAAAECREVLELFPE